MRMVIQRIMCNFASKTKTIIKEERNTTMKKEDLRIVFMGTPEFAVETLKRLVEGGYNVVGVVTQPDKPVGRHGSVLRAPAVKEYAFQKGLPVLQPEKMKDPQFVEALVAWNADLQVVVAFRMLPEVVWAMPSFGTFNVHAALLPRYRGAAPINWAIINGEKKTGVTTFFLDHDIDTGRIIKQKEFDIPDEMATLLRFPKTTSFLRPMKQHFPTPRRSSRKLVKSIGIIRPKIFTISFAVSPLFQPLGQHYIKKVKRRATELC